jgi:hypothetical protein
MFPGQSVYERNDSPAYFTHLSNPIPNIDAIASIFGKQENEIGKTGILAVAERPLKVAVGLTPRIVNDRSSMASRRDAMSGWEPFTIGLRHRERGGT